MVRHQIRTVLACAAVLLGPSPATAGKIQKQKVGTYRYDEVVPCWTDSRFVSLGRVGIAWLDFHKPRTNDGKPSWRTEVDQPRGMKWGADLTLAPACDLAGWVVRSQKRSKTVKVRLIQADGVVRDSSIVKGRRLAGYTFAAGSGDWVGSAPGGLGQWIFDADTGEVLRRTYKGWKLTGTLLNLAAVSRPSEAGDVVLADESGQLFLFDASTGEVGAPLPNSPGIVPSVGFIVAADGGHVLVSDGDVANVVSLDGSSSWSVANRGQRPAQDGALSRDGQRVALASERRVWVYDRTAPTSPRDFGIQVRDGQLKFDLWVDDIRFAGHTDDELFIVSRGPKIPLQNNLDIMHGSLWWVGLP